MWDNLSVHLRAFTGAKAWLRVFRLPAYALDLNPVEGIWWVLKGGVLASLAVASFGHLAQVIRHGLKKIQYQPGLIKGCCRRRSAITPKYSAAGWLSPGTQSMSH